MINVPLSTNWQVLPFKWLDWVVLWYRIPTDRVKGTENTGFWISGRNWTEYSPGIFSCWVTAPLLTVNLLGSRPSEENTGAESSAGPSHSLCLDGKRHTLSVLAGGRNGIISLLLYLCPTGPLPFWHQGLVSWKTIFPWTVVGGWFQDDSNAVHLVGTLFLLLLYQLYLKSSGISDPRSWGPLLYSVPISLLSPLQPTLSLPSKQDQENPQLPGFLVVLTGGTLNLSTHLASKRPTMCKIDSWWEATAQHRKLRLELCDGLDGWYRGGGPRGREYMYTL